jgi:hypothetical protein
MHEAERKIFESFTPQERESAEHLNEQGRQIELKVYGLRGRPEPDHYALDENNVCVPVGLGTWAVWSEQQRRNFEHSRLRIGSDTWWTWSVGRVLVSTVFLGSDHSFGSGHRALFETMVFFTRWSLPHWIQRHIPWTWKRRLWLSRNDQFLCRYATYDQAKRGHARVLTMTQRYLKWEVTRDEFYDFDPINDEPPPERRIRL